MLTDQLGGRVEPLIRKERVLVGHANLLSRAAVQFLVPTSSSGPLLLVAAHRTEPCPPCHTRAPSHGGAAGYVTVRQPPHAENAVASGPGPVPGVNTKAFRGPVAANGSTVTDTRSSVSEITVTAFVVTPGAV